MSALVNQQGSASHDVVKHQSDTVTSGHVLDNHEILKAWVSQHGGYIHSDLEIAFHAVKGFHAIVKDGKTISAQAQIASCPMPLTLSVLNALNVAPFENHGSQFPKEFLERYKYATDVLQSFFLMEQYVLGSQSWWAPYIKTLPTIHAIEDLQFDSDADIAWIQGTNLEAATASQIRKWISQYEEAVSLLKELGWAHATDGAYDFSLYRWAVTMFGSRSFTSQVLDDTKPADIARPMGRKDPDHDMLSTLFSQRFAVLLPLLDILNHRPSAQVEWQARVDHVTLQVLEEYTSGDEVFNNYGPRDNEGLLMCYGFVLEDNPFEHVLISVNAHPGTPLEIARTWPKDERSNDNHNCYIFDICHPIVKEAKFLERALFSYDLLDSISVMCGNDRELQAMYQKRQTLMSICLPNLFDDHRNVLATLAQIMYDSDARVKRMEATDPSRLMGAGELRTQKQKNAQIYRRKQISILRAAYGVCAFALFNAGTDQQVSDLLLNMQLRFPDIHSPDLEDICTRLPCLTKKNELFTAMSLIELLPSPTANGVRACLKDIERAILEAGSSILRSHGDRVRTSFTISLSALCATSRTETQLPHRLAEWFGELTSSYPPEDPNWNYVPPPGPYEPDEEPPPALMTLLEASSKIVSSLGTDSTAKTWVEPKMICWAWNVMEEEGIRVPIEVERFVSEEPTEVDGITGFLMYCKQY